MTTPERDAERARQLLSRHLYRRTSEGPIFDQGLVDDLTLAFAAAREDAVREENEAICKIVCYGCQEGWPINREMVALRHEIPTDITTGRMWRLCDAAAIRSRTHRTEEG